MTDTHIHIERGPYQKDWIDQFVKQALSAGLSEIYLLEHSHRFVEFSPMYAAVCKYSAYQEDWYRKRVGLSIRQYEDFISEMRVREFPVKIKWGLEVCYFPQFESLISKITRAFDYDFITGAIHWIDGFGFDHKGELWAGIDVDALYLRYYDLMAELVKSGLFTGLAHPDSIKCFCKYPTLDLSEQYASLADALIQNSVYAEQSGGLALNYGFYEKGMNRLMLSIFKEKGVSLRFASDAHRPQDVGANLAEMQDDL